MAKYTKVVYDRKTIEFGEIFDSSGNNPHTGAGGNFIFQLGDMSKYVITKVVVAANITYRGKYGVPVIAADLKVGSSTVAQYPKTENNSTWSASGLSITDKNPAVTVDLKKTGYNPGDYPELLQGIAYSNASCTVTYTAEFSETIASPIDGDTISSYLQNTFSWSLEIASGSISSQKLYWKYKDEEKYKIIELGKQDTEYTFPSRFFNNGTINWYVEAIDTTGNKATSTIQTVTVGVVPRVVISYPNNVNIRNVNQQIFTWEMMEDVDTGQKSYELAYRVTKESKWTVLNITAKEQYHEFAAYAFETDSYEWRIKVTNNDGLSSDYVSAKFVSVGSTDAPDIVEITNESIPTIKWKIPSQDTFELELYAGSERIYTSGIQIGHNIRKYTPNIILEDGNYLVKMRAMNEYGYFTEWTEYSFVLSHTNPPMATDIIVYANECHGIDIMIDNSKPKSDGIYYVIRRIFGEEEWKYLGKIESDEIYSDNSVIKNVKYEYAIRTYVPFDGVYFHLHGVTDSPAVSIIINYDGAIIYNGNDFVTLYKTEEEQFQISHTPSKSYSYSYTIGRKYPVRESSEWMAHVVSVSSFVTFDEYKKLEEFYESNNDLWYKDKDFSFKCSIDSIQIQETLLGKGYTITVELSRTDENEVNLLE